MKEIIILISVLVLVFVPNIAFKKYLHSSGNELIKIVDELREKVENEDNINEDEVNALKKAFLEKEKIWILIVDHDMLDEIEYEVEDCTAQYSIENKRDFISAASRLHDKIEDLSKREEITLGNIL